jgi:hypothetical protein
LIVFHALFRPKEGIIKLKKRKEVKNMNLIEKVFEEMSSDADGNEKQAEIMEQEYMDATEDQKKAIDRVFIALCGWSLKTLIEGHEATESYNPYK